MPFEIIRGDVTQLRVDAVVNAANPEPVVGYGVDAGIHKKAGPQLLEARKKIGPIPVGQAAVTKGYALPAKYVIHAVGPVWQGGEAGETGLLRQCYDSALRLAAKKRCRSVAFPLLSAGNYGFPKAVALQIAVSAFSAFLMDHDMRIILAVFDRDAFALSEKLFQSVQSYIDEHYIQTKLLEEYDLSQKADLGDALPRRMEAERNLRGSQFSAPLPSPPSRAAETARPMPTAAPRPSLPRASLEDMLERADAGFSETLMKLIDRTGKKDAEIYKRANIDRKLFSKIRSNPAYRPSKSTALAFAVALELDLDETRDFIGRAGYALTHSSKFDIIVEYFILQRNYNIFELNETLFAFDQPLIGGA